MKKKNQTKRNGFIFYPRQRVENIVQNNEDKIEDSIVNNEEKSISLEEKEEKTADFTSKQ